MHIMPYPLTCPIEFREKTMVSPVFFQACMESEQLPMQPAAAYFMQLVQNLLDYCQQLIVSASFGVSRLRLQLKAVHTVSRNLNTPMFVLNFSISNILTGSEICKRISAQSFICFLHLFAFCTDFDARTSFCSILQ